VLFLGFFLTPGLKQIFTERRQFTVTAANGGELVNGVKD
jgi:hypothetical protein